MHFLPNSLPVTRRQFLATTGLALTSLPSLVQAASEPNADDPASWAQFLGPKRDGIVRETGLNLDWQTKKPAVLWKAPVGNSYSSFAIVGDRLYTQVKRDKRDIVVCLDTQKDGKELWSCDGAPTYLDKQRQGAGPRSTPTYHQGKLYCLFPMGELLCVNAADGKELWRTNVFEASGAKNRAVDPKANFYYWGMSGSPLVENDFVIVQPGGNKNNSLVALRTDNGKLAWGAGDDPPGYSSPIVITVGGRRVVVSFTGQSLLGVEPSKGTVLFRYALGNRFDCNCATPLWADGLLFGSAAYGAGCAAVEVSADGDKVAAKEKWRNRDLQNQFTNSVVVKGHIYGSSGDLGAVVFRCLELATGRVRWEDRRPGKCSLLAIEDHILAVNERGTLRLIEANPDKYVPKGEIDGVLTYKCWAAPALLKGRLYVRDDKQLVCFDMRKG